MDPVTDLPNRAAWDDRLRQEHARWRRFGAPLCLAVFDVDNFKSINDRFGHAAATRRCGSSPRPAQAAAAERLIGATVARSSPSC